MMERRKHPRIKGKARMVYKFSGSVGEKRDEVVDISQGGVRMEVHEKAKKGDVVELGVVLDEKGEPFFALGTVVWQSDKPASTRGGKEFYETGIQFSEMGIKNKMGLIKYIYGRIKEERGTP